MAKPTFSLSLSENAPNTKKEKQRKTSERKKALVQPVTPKRKPAKKAKKDKKTSLAELPAELKHITQRCKKKVTTIAKVTASELAIFKKHMTKNVIFPLSPAWKTKDVWFKKIAKKKRKTKVERCWSKKCLGVWRLSLSSWLLFYGENGLGSKTREKEKKSADEKHHKEFGGGAAAHKK